VELLGLMFVGSRSLDAPARGEHVSCPKNRLPHLTNLLPQDNAVIAKEVYSVEEKSGSTQEER